MACPNMCMYKHWRGTVGYAKVGGKKWLKVKGKDCRRKCKCVMGPKKSVGETKLKCRKRCYKRRSKCKGRRKKRRNCERKKKTGSPTTNPTTLPTVSPTTIPTDVPTSNPTVSPTVSPTNIPTSNPTQKPTVLPTQNPTVPSPSLLIDLMRHNFANDWDEPLSFQAGTNRMITGFYSSHDNGKEDRRYAFYTMSAPRFS